MKIISRSIARLAFWLAIIIFCHSCKATYHDSFHSVLRDASEKDKRIKIKTKDSQILEYKNVVFMEDNFLGVTKVKGIKVRTPIDTENIRSIRTESKVMLGVLKITGAIIFTGILLVFIYIDITNEFDDDDDDE